MDGNGYHTLWCLVAGDSTPYEVTVHADSSIHTLKKLIFAESGIANLHSVVAKDLTLWKLNKVMALQPDDTLHERVRNLVARFATKLSVSSPVSMAFALQPPRTDLHILAGLPLRMTSSVSAAFHVVSCLDNESEAKAASSSRKRARSSTSSEEDENVSASIYTANLQPEETDMYTPRLETVAAIYDKLQRYKYVQILGPPGSGKTSLAKLLRNYILDRGHPSVVRVPKWSHLSIGGWRAWVAAEHYWDAGPGSVLIVDEAQTSYGDSVFWDDIKSITPEWPYSIVTFASYGSLVTDPSVATPHLPCQGQVVGLHANVVDYGNDVKVGLLLTRDEFRAFVEKIFSGHLFDDQFLDGIYDLTAGHVGACEDIIRLIQCHDSYRGLKYTLDSFNANVEPYDILGKLSGTSIFARGLPKNGHMQRPRVAQILQDLVLHGKKDVVAPTPFTDEKMDADLAVCVKNGWLYSEHPRPSVATHVYVFASPLHARWVQWKLLGKSDGKVREKTVLNFALAILRHFSPLNATEERPIGSTFQSIPEAQFQDEFYRACTAHTRNCVVSFPEFGTKRGRIDFFIPSKKWGIELLRKGKRLLPHIKPFTETVYGSWVTAGTMKDYIVLDFRLSKPPNKHRKFKNLYYVVYQEGWKEVTVYDHNCKIVDNFTPMYNS